MEQLPNFFTENVKTFEIKIVKRIEINFKYNLSNDKLIGISIIITIIRNCALSKFVKKNKGCQLKNLR